MKPLLDFNDFKASSATYFVYQTPLGRVSIQAHGDAITRISLGAVEFDAQLKATSLTNNAATQVQEYLAAKRREFDLPLAPQGSDFQLLVWQQLCKIPYGSTMSYAHVAKAIGRENAYRAVGMAANRNPLILAVPCHRVVGSDGSLVGFACGLHVKRYLLDLESSSMRQ